MGKGGKRWEKGGNLEKPEAIIRFALSHNTVKLGTFTFHNTIRLNKPIDRYGILVLNRH